jgi:methylenetetrahydrofolate dehydrogenase (NADP+)/methenyltetrahydrofolate cyclohydrolase
MTAQLIDGKALAKTLRNEIAAEVSDKKLQGLRQPGLAVILVGDDPASTIYVTHKRQACEEVGIKSIYHHLPNNVNEQTLMDLIQAFNQDKTIDGILLQLPLPPQIDSNKLLELIEPHKDVDGFHPYNLGRLAQRHPFLRPCTPFGIMMMLDSIQQVYKNRHAVVIGASNIVGRPMALELLMAGCTVTICHRFTADLAEHVNQADILVSAAGQPNLIQGNWIKSGATVIVGDVEFSAAVKRAAWITPVPGGVGPMTVVMLLRNTMIAANKTTSSLLNRQQQ